MDVTPHVSFTCSQSQAAAEMEAWRATQKGHKEARTAKLNEACRGIAWQLIQLAERAAEYREKTGGHGQHEWSWAAAERLLLAKVHDEKSFSYNCEDFWKCEGISTMPHSLITTLLSSPAPCCFYLVLTHPVQGARQ